MLIVLCGLPGSGKSTVSREVARQLGATYLRIDSIEKGLRSSFLAIHPAADAGYTVAYALARDNIAIGRTVIADSVNGIRLTQSAWENVAMQTGCELVLIEFVCSDVTEHRSRIESRDKVNSDRSPTPWQKVLNREYLSPAAPHHVLDTANKAVQQSVAEMLAILSDASATRAEVRIEP